MSGASPRVVDTILRHAGRRLVVGVITVRGYFLIENVFDRLLLFIPHHFLDDEEPGMSHGEYKV